MLWICEVEDARSIDDLTTSASVKNPDFDNLDFQIASGFRKILTRNLGKQVTTAEGKAQSEKDHLQPDRLLG